MAWFLYVSCANCFYSLHQSGLGLDKNLRLLDANDPVKYDFALFGLGISNEL